MENKSKKRSRNGCLTCRRRKKKCDELLYPQCRNCHTNELQCTWPDHIVKAQKLRETKVPKRERDETPGIPETSNTILSPERILTTIDPATLTLSQSAYPEPESLRRQSDSHLMGIEKQHHRQSHKDHLSGVSKSGVQHISQPLHSKTPQQEYHISKPQIALQGKNDKKTNYFLQRIAMQQDCVEEDEKEDEQVYGRMDRDLIRNIIAHQMDLGESLKRG